MTIRNMIKVAAIVIAVIIATGAVIAGLKINQIRMGGPIQTANQQMSDLVADILPPPAYVLEPYLEATLLLMQPEQLPQRKARLAQLERDYTTRMDYWHETEMDAGIKTLLTDQAHESGQVFWKDINEALLPAIARGDMISAQAAYDKISADYRAHRKLIDDTVIAATANQNGLKTESAQALSKSILILTSLGVALALILAVASWLLLNRVVKPIVRTADAMDAMAKGNNHIILEGADQDNEIGRMVQSVEVFREAAIAREAAETEIATAREEQGRTVAGLGEALDALAAGQMTFRLNTPFPPSYEALRVNFNAAMDAFQAMLSDVSLAAECIRTGSSEIATASDDLSRRTEQQAASLEETAAAMDQVAASVSDTAKGAGEASQSVSAAQNDATEGGRIVGLAVDAMQGIEKSSREIANIITVIDGIAFQTNLLALNAGVEAARAGDAGKGFAVVANEVRALAQRSADAAKDIKELITLSWSQVETGVKLVGQTGEALDRIVGRVGEIARLTGNIAHAASEQAVSTQQVNSVVTDMDKMTQQNAAMVEQSTAAARSLADEADKLAGLVQQFDLGKPASARAQHSARKPQSSRAAPPVRGNLALKDDPDQDWTDF